MSQTRKTSDQTRIRRWWVTIATPAVSLYWLAMFTGTHMPNPEAVIGPEVSDKLLHFLAYFVLYVLLSARFRVVHAEFPKRRDHFRLLALTSAYAVVDELLQAVPIINRHADVEDAVADWSGLIAGAVVVWMIERLSRRTANRRN